MPRRAGGDGRGDVADEHRLEACATAADQRQQRRDARHGGEAIEELVLGPEDDRGAHDDGAGEFLEHRRLALRLGAGITGRGLGVGADGRDMDETRGRRPRAPPWRRPRTPSTCMALNVWRPLLASTPTQLTTARRPSARCTDAGIAQIGLHRRDLPDEAHGLQKPASSGRRTAARTRHPCLASAAPRNGRRTPSRRTPLPIPWSSSRSAIAAPRTLARARRRNPRRPS